MARLASSSESDLSGIRVEYLSEPSVSNPNNMEVDSIDIRPSWTDLILEYLTTGSLPIEKFEARCIKYQSARYHIINRVLYKRRYTLLYLRCVHPTQVRDILQEIHIGGRALSRRALLQEYYWPTMARDLQDYVK